jgi:hypothetical protein
MPQGKGTYGSKVGRPPQNKRKPYNKGTQALTQEERKQSKRNDLRMSARVQIDREENEYPQKEIDRAYKALVKNSKTFGFSKGDVDFELQSERERRADERREAAIEANPLLEKRQVRAEGGELDDQMNALAISVAPAKVEEVPKEEQEMLPDEEMEEDYVDYVVSSTLSEEDQNYLESALEKNARLSKIFDQVVESASEFSGSGPIEGPGTEVSDSIPARLSDGEFVFTAKATDEIGADNLQRMMEDAEAGADERQSVATGGVIEEDEQQQALAISTEGTAESKGNIPSVLPLRATEEELHKSMLQASPRQYYRPTSG